MESLSENLSSDEQKKKAVYPLPLHQLPMQVTQYPYQILCGLNRFVAFRAAHAFWYEAYRLVTFRRNNAEAEDLLFYGRLLALRESGF